MTARSPFSPPLDRHRSGAVVHVPGAPPPAAPAHRAPRHEDARAPDQLRAGRRHLALYVTRVLVDAPRAHSVWDLLLALKAALERYETGLRQFYVEYRGGRDPRTGEIVSPFPP